MIAKMIKNINIDIMENALKNVLIILIMIMISFVKILKIINVIYPKVILLQ